jgi:prepilin-type N-terminal cleavage/methylation domain-containing protein/prepilin-type processing-associated H-X9-DG protein
MVSGNHFDDAWGGGAAAVHLRRGGVRNRPVGFTLIELLVVVSIIALLIAILLPALEGAREDAQKLRCATNHKTLIAAVRMYADENRDYLPLANWESMDPLPGWLYAGRSRNWPRKLERRREDHDSGLLWRYTRADEIYRCPRHDVVFENPRAARSNWLTSYLMNGAVVDFDASEYVARTRSTYQITRYRVDAIIFWEPPELELFPQYSFNDGSSFPYELLTRRHRDGATVAHVDGHTSWLTHDQYGKTLERQPGPLWCAPGFEDGGGPFVWP